LGVVLALLGFSWLAPCTAHAQTSGTWNLNANGNYSPTVNWLGGVPNAGGVATFGGVITADRTVTLDINPTLGGLMFNNVASQGGYTLSTTSSFFTLTAGSVITNATPVATAVNVPFTLQGNLTFTGNGIGPLTIGGVISESAPAGIVVNTSAPYPDLGVVALNGANTFTGGVTLQAGSLQVGSNSALGTGTLTVNGGFLRGGVPSATTAGNAVQLNTDLIFSGGALTLSGVIDDGAGSFRVVNVARQGTGTLTLTAANTYGGETVVGRPADAAATLPFAGISANTVLTGAGTALNSSGFTVNGGATLRLDNRSGPSAIGRIGASAPVTLNNGTFTIQGGTALSGAFTQNAGLLTGTGHSTVNVATNSLSSEGVTLNFAGLNRGPSGTATFLFTGNINFGSAPGPGVTRLTSTAPPPTTGGALGTPGAAIIPFATGSSGFVTYGTNGVRGLQSGESVPDALTANANVVLTFSSPTNNGNVTINSLFINNGTGVTGTGTLTVTSGAIAVKVSGVGISNNLAFGSAQANIFVGTTATDFSDSLSITGRISGSGGLTKSGLGVLFLAPGNTYTGTTAINDGAVVITDPSAFGASTSAIELYGRAGGPASFIPEIANGADGLALNLARPLAVNNGNAMLTGAGRQSVTVLGGTISGNGGLFFQGNPQATAGITFLTGNNTYSGGTNLYWGNVAWGSDANLGAATGPVDFGTDSTTGVLLMGNWTTSRAVNLSASVKFDTNGFNATLGGRLTGDIGYITLTGLYKTGDGTLALSNIGTGGMTPGVVVNGGTVALTGDSRLPRSAEFTLNSGTLLLDNTGTAADHRLNTGTSVRFGSGGAGTLRIDAGTSAVTQNLVSLNLSGTAHGRVVMTAGTGGSVRLALTDTPTAGYELLSARGSSLFVSGDGLVNTSTATSMGQTGMVFTTAPLQIFGHMAGNGPAGTTTVGILRGGYGARTTGGTNPVYGLLTQTSTTVGVRLLGESNEYASTQAANANVLIQAPAPTFTGATAINAVYVRGGNSLTISSGATLTVASGTFLSTGSTAGSPNRVRSDLAHGGGAVLTSSEFGSVNSGFVFATVTDLELNAALLGSGTGGSLVKVDAGTLIFNPLDATGAPVGSTNVPDTRVLGGTLRMPANQTITSLPGNLILADGATFQYQGAGAATAKTVTLNGAGGTLDLTGTFLHLTGGDNTIRAVEANGGTLRLVGGTLILGNGTAGTPAVTQRNSYQDGTNLVGGILILNADSTLGDANGTVLGYGPLRLMGGQLAPKFKTRDVAVPVEAFAGTVFVNNTTTGGTDTANAGLTFRAPVRLENSVTLTNNMTGGDLTFAGSIYDNPYKPASGVTFAAAPNAGATVLTMPAIYRGGTTVASGTLRVQNALGSATGTGNVTVNAGARLAGGAQGFIVPADGGTVTVNGGLSPGNGTAAVGTLTVGAADRAVAVTVGGSQSRYTFTITGTNPGSATPITDGSSTASEGTSNNRLLVLGSGSSTLTFSPATFEIVDPVAGLGANWDGSKYYSWVVARVVGGMASVSAPAAIDLSAFHNALSPQGNFSLALSGNAVVVNYSPVPEPGGVLAVAVAAAALVRWVRRHRATTATVGR
jgi:autotransporter-associated beta strand protein